VSDQGRDKGGELADAAVPPPPEQDAMAVVPETDSSDVDLDDEDELTTGLPAGTEIDVDESRRDELLEAELTAISEGDPETAAILADELERGGRGGAET
jgi:hypothetical protein